MTRFERLRVAFDGGPVDRIPLSFWQHFPEHDAHPRTLSEATVAYQQRYDLDFVKLMPTGMYSVVDYGVRTRPSGDAIGTTVYAGGRSRGQRIGAGGAVTGPVEALVTEARDAIAQTQGRRLIVAPGCVVPTTAPDEHLAALRKVVG